MADEDDVRAMEIEAISSMFPEDFKVDDDDQFAFVVVVRPLGLDGPALELQVSLPDGYPAMSPSLRLNSDILSRQGADALQQGMLETIEEQSGDMCMMAVVSYLQDSAAEHLQQALDKAAAATSSAKEKPARKRENERNGTKLKFWEEYCLVTDVGAEWSLCHCIPKDLDFSACELPRLKKQFGGLDELRSQKLDLGSLGVLHKRDRYVYYMVTKLRSGRSSMNSLEAALGLLKERVVQDGVQKLAMAIIGGKSEGLTWGSVQEAIMRVFDDVPMEFLVCSE